MCEALVLVQSLPKICKGVVMLWLRYLTLSACCVTTHYYQSFYSNKISINNINEKYHHIHMMWKKNLILSLDSPKGNEALSSNEISDYSYSQLSPRSMNEKVEEELERLGRLLKGGNNIPPPKDEGLNNHSPKHQHNLNEGVEEETMSVSGDDDTRLFKRLVAQELEERRLRARIRELETELAIRVARTELLRTMFDSTMLSIISNKK